MKMTLNKFSVLFGAVMIAALTGCGSKPAAVPATAPAPASAVQSGAVDTPPWLNDFPPDGVYWGIGTAKVGDTSMSMTFAESRARSSIARQVKMTAQSLLTDLRNASGSIGNQSTAADQMIIDRQITDEQLTGARPIKRWVAPDGTWWYLVEYKKSDAKQKIASIFNNQEAAFAQFKAQQALQMLDVQLAKQEKPIVVDN